MLGPLACLGKKGYLFGLPFWPPHLALDYYEKTEYGQGLLRAFFSPFKAGRRYAWGDDNNLRCQYALWEGEASVGDAFQAWSLLSSAAVRETPEDVFCGLVAAGAVLLAKYFLARQTATRHRWHPDALVTPYVWREAGHHTKVYPVFLSLPKAEEECLAGLCLAALFSGGALMS